MVNHSILLDFPFVKHKQHEKQGTDNKRGEGVDVVPRIWFLMSAYNGFAFTHPRVDLTEIIGYGQTNHE